MSPAVRIQIHAGPAHFDRAARAYLERDEVRNALMLGICRGALANSALVTAHLTTLIRDDAVVGATFQSAGYPVMLAVDDDLSLDPIARDIFDRDPGLIGVFAQAGPAESFARAWAKHSGRPATVRMRQRIFKLDRVTPPLDRGGLLRLAGPGDLDLVADWTSAFVSEAIPHHPQTPAQLRTATENKIRRKDVYLWINNDRAVATAALTGRTARGVRINSVYTPPAERGRGFRQSRGRGPEPAHARRGRGVLYPVHRPEQPGVEQSVHERGLPAGL